MNNINVIKQADCLGCTACSTVCSINAIEFITNVKGFLYPNVTDSCIECGLCLKKCPLTKGLSQSYLEPKVYAVKHRVSDVLLKSSSGGLFTAISDYILQNGGVVYGAVHGDNLKTKHSRALTKDERDKQRGSKYVQSDLGSIFKSVISDLKEGMMVLFVGMPCQIAGLSEVVPVSLREKLLLVDFICNGAPSPKLFNEYILYCEKKQKSKIIEHYHRPKDFGWSHVEKNIFEDGRIDNISEYSQAWKKIFYSGNILRDCCYRCRYASRSRVSDITIGDYWGVQNTRLTISSTNGVSLYIGNTERGIQFINNITSELIIEESSYTDASAKQPRLRGVCASSAGVDRFWDEYNQKGSQFVIEKYGECSRLYIIKHLIKRYLIKMYLWK